MHSHSTSSSKRVWMYHWTISRVSSEYTEVQDGQLWLTEQQELGSQKSHSLLDIFPSSTSDVCLHHVSLLSNAPARTRGEVSHILNVCVKPI